MKKFFLLTIVAFFISVSSYAQIVNGGFEAWTNGSPDGWFTSNVPPFVTTVTQSNTAHTGKYSVRGDVINFSGVVLSPLIQSGLVGKGFSIVQRYATVSGYYQFSPVGGDVISMVFLLFKGINPIGTAQVTINTAASTWTQFSADFLYISADTPDTTIIQFSILGPASNDVHAGSFFLLDDISLSGTATCINDPKAIPAVYSLEQNYPNPFNPSTKINYNLPENSFVSLKIYNAIGEEVASLINGNISAGTHEIVFDASKFNSGIYFYTLRAGDKFVQTKKMILIK